MGTFYRVTCGIDVTSIDEYIYYPYVMLWMCVYVLDIVYTYSTYIHMYMFNHCLENPMSKILIYVHTYVCA